MKFIAKDWDRHRLELERAFDDLGRPMAPTAVFRCTTANRPPAADYPFHILFNQTTGALEVSDGTSWV